MSTRRWYNPMVNWLLRSPLHGVMSGSTLLLTFAGRRSGRRYTTPISYARDGSALTLITNRKHGWWRNLQAPASVTARVAGRDLCGMARVVPAAGAELVAAVQTVYHGIPPEQAARLAPDVVLIRIDLN